MTTFEQYHKNINQLYLNNFDIPEFNILKNYRLKLMNDDNYVNDLLIYLNMNDNYINDINILIDRIDILIYYILVSKLQNKDEHYGLIFGYSNDLNKNISTNAQQSNKIIKSKIKQYEPNNLLLFRKYNIFKIFDYLNNFDFENINDIINLITDFENFKAKNKDIDDTTLKNKFHNYYLNKFK